MTWEIPLTDVVMTDDDLRAVADCLRSGWLTMGPRTDAFETAVAAWTGSPHATAVSSGSAALQLACAALELGPGDEVIVPAWTFLATAGAPRTRGATVVLCDVLAPETPLIDVADVQRRITDRTRAVIAVHMCGHPADVTALRELCAPRGIAVVEDAAQAFGAQVDARRSIAGTAGVLGCLSFSSKKQLCVGEGGMVLTADPALEARVRLLRSHAMTSGTWDRHRGHEDSYDVLDVGFNFRLDEPRAALGLSRLPRVGADLELRRAAVAAYRDALSELEGLVVMWAGADLARASPFAFTVLLDSRASRDRVRAALARDGIQTTAYPALHELTEYRPWAPAGSLPHAEAVGARQLALPLSAQTTEARVGVVAAALARALDQPVAATSSGSRRARMRSKSSTARS